MISVSAYTIYCEGCDASFVVPTNVRNPTAWEAIQQSQDWGWTRFGEKDYCPNCPGFPRIGQPVEFKDISEVGDKLSPDAGPTNWWGRWTLDRLFGIRK